MILLRIILIPFSLLYSLIILIRNKLYDAGILISRRVSVPVISVGNITTGGTGKTPFTIFLAKHFLDKGMKVGIISRGYKRDSNELMIVSDGNKINHNVEESGDELILIADELIKEHKGKFFIAADKDRVEAAEYIIKEFKPDLIILDDGFQHRKLKKNLDIVLIDAENYFSNKFANTFTLPSGNLRESFSGLKRADIIIQNNKDKQFDKINKLELPGKIILTIRYKSEFFMDYKNSILQTKEKNVIAFSGIANNVSFISMINESFNVREVITYPDHHRYLNSDIETLSEKYSEDCVFVTTEKDFVKIREFPDFIQNYPVYYLKMKLEVNDNETGLYKKIDDIIR